MIRPPGRFALTRLPSPLLHHPAAEGLLNLLASTSERNYPQVYARAEALAETLSADADLGIFGPSMVKSFIGKWLSRHGSMPSLTPSSKASFRSRAFNLISKAYTSIPVSLAESYLGLPRDEMLPSKIVIGYPGSVL